MIAFKKILALKSLLLITSISIAPMAFASESFGEKLYNRLIGPWEKAASLTEKAAEKRLSEPPPTRERVLPPRTQTQPLPPDKPETRLLEPQVGPQSIVHQPRERSVTTTQQPATSNRGVITRVNVPRKATEQKTIEVKEVKIISGKLQAIPADRQQQVSTPPRGRIQSAPRGVNVRYHQRYRERIIRDRTYYQRQHTVTRVKSSPLSSPLRIKLQKMRTH